MNLQAGVLLCIFAVASSNLLGGMKEVDSNDENVRQVIDWTVNHLNRMMNSAFHHVLLNTPQVNRQVVNGFKYHIVLNLVQTSCRNTADNLLKTAEECPISNNGKMQECDLVVLDSEFHGKFSMETFKCTPKESSGILGGDGHDYVPHGKPRDGKHLLGQDMHDLIPHLKERSSGILGGDGHDYVPHGEPKELNSGLLGGDGHDYVPHGNLKDVKQLLGKDMHDFIPHLKQQNSGILGGDGHDYVIHGKQPKDSKHLLGQDMHDLIHHRPLQGVHHMSILGGDDSDYQPHKGDHCMQYKEGFKQFTAKFNRLYGSPREEAKRFQIFCTNMDRVKEYRKMERGSAVYGATIFADISEEEFRKNYMGFNTDVKSGKTWPAADIPQGPVPTSFDWRKHGAVTPVKNQGSCGSCWAFSTTGNLEGQTAIKNKKLLSLSEQELVDCDKVDLGCGGGLPSQAYEALEKLGGIETESDYSYEGHGDTCHFNKTKVVVKVTGALNISQDEQEIAAWLAKNGPISIGINAFAMQFYFGGISHPWKIFCNPKSLDHGVLIVGYGEDNGEPYWIIKNSWGPGWGRQGYYYVYRGDGVCGLNTMCTSGTIA